MPVQYTASRADERDLQLLIDLQVLKAHLLKLPGDFVTSGYTKSVNKATTRLETLLKVVMTLVVR